MREIKFRAWDGRNEEMFVPNKLEWSKQGTPQAKMYWFNKNCCWNEDMVLMQFTGLKDRNGVEIYEGDILGSTNPKEILVKFIVQWGYKDNPYSWGLKSLLTGNSYEFCDHKKLMEVIGNIYSNPELLTR